MNTIKSNRVNHQKCGKYRLRIVSPIIEGPLTLLGDKMSWCKIQQLHLQYRAIGDENMIPISSCFSGH